MTSLDGRVAIITGAGRGIGREHALLFAADKVNPAGGFGGKVCGCFGSDGDAVYFFIFRVLIGIGKNNGIISGMIPFRARFFTVNF